MMCGLGSSFPNTSSSTIRSGLNSQYTSAAGTKTSADYDGRRKDFVFVVNPKGANGTTGREWKKVLPQLRKRLGDQCNAIKEGAGAVISVGGDGTLHEVVNGFFEEGEPVISRSQERKHSTVLGLIPLGTGSDFARTFGWNNNQLDAIERIAKGEKTTVDVGVITGDGREPHYFINVADIHLSAKAGFYASKYKWSGNLCYVFGTLRAFMGHSNQDFRIKINGGDWENFDQVTAACLGNAKFFGGGMKITPTADPCSGTLEVVILQNFKWYGFLLNLNNLYNGTHLSLKNVCSRSVQTFEIEEKVPTGSIYIQSDGEHLGFLPRKISILPGAIEMFC